MSSEFIMACTCTLLFLAVSVQAQQDDTIVRCSSNSTCDAGEFMTARQCCVENPDGFAYILPGQENCVVCIGEFLHNTYK